MNGSSVTRRVARGATRTLFAILALSSCQALAQHVPHDPPCIADQCAPFADKTNMSFDTSHGTQVEYLRADGATFLLYPGNKIVLPGRWRLESRKGGAAPSRICFKYGTNTYNPATRQVGGQWECTAAKGYTRRVADQADGDVFNLAKSPAAPFILSKEKTTISELLRRHPTR